MAFFKKSFSSLNQDTLNELAILALTSAAGLSQIMGTIADDESDPQFPYAFLESLTFMTATALFRAQAVYRFDNPEQQVSFIKAMQLGYSQFTNEGEIRVGHCVLSREMLNVTISNDLFCKVVLYVIGDLPGLGIDEEKFKRFCESTNQRVSVVSSDIAKLSFSIFQLRVISFYASACDVDSDKLLTLIRYISDSICVFVEKIDICLDK